MYQSVENEEDSCDSVSASRPARNKGPSRCYNLTMIVFYFALLIMAVVALGTFGVKEAQIIDLARRAVNTTDHSCILYSTYLRKKDIDEVVLKLHSSGLCGYVFWGLTSVTIVAFAWLVNSIVQAAIGPRVISLLRVLDLIVILFCCFFSLALSATIDAGLSQTCAASLKNPDTNKYTTCEHAYFNVSIPGQKMQKLYYYDVISTTKASSWMTTVTLAGLSVWYTIMVISYCCVVSQRRRRRKEALIQECDSDSS